MNYEDFLIRDQSPLVHQSAYKTIKRCPSCQSVYLTDLHCDACGRSLTYHLLGEPFSEKSFFGIKERYVDSFSLLEKWFPLIEDKEKLSTKFYTKQITNRFELILQNIIESDNLASDDRRLFYIELLFIIDELMYYGTTKSILESKINDFFNESNQVLHCELIYYLNHYSKQSSLNPLSQLILQYRIGGMRIDFILKALILAVTSIFAALYYYGPINLLFGK